MLRAPRDQTLPGYGTISARLTWMFIRSSMQCGISEETLRKTQLTRAFEVYLNWHEIVPWRDLLALVETVYSETKSLREMEKIGEASYDVIAGTVAGKFFMGL